MTKSSLQNKVVRNQNIDINDEMGSRKNIGYGRLIWSDLSSGLENRVADLNSQPGASVHPSTPPITSWDLDSFQLSYGVQDRNPSIAVDGGA